MRIEWYGIGKVTWHCRHPLVAAFSVTKLSSEKWEELSYYQPKHALPIALERTCLHLVLAKSLIGHSLFSDIFKITPWLL